MLSESMVFGVLAVVLGMLTGALICVARRDVETVEKHLDVSAGLGKLFAVGAFFCAVFEKGPAQRLLSLCAGGAVFCFAYYSACRVAFYMRR